MQIQEAKFQAGATIEEVGEWTINLEKRVETYETALRKIDEIIKKIKDKELAEVQQREDQIKSETREKELKFEQEKLEQRLKYESQISKQSDAPKGSSANKRKISNYIK